MACEVPHSAMADSEPMLGSAWSVRFEDRDFLLRFRDDDFILWMRMWTILTDGLVVQLTGRRLHRAGRTAVLCTGLGLQVPACVQKCYESTFPAKLTQATEVKLQGTAFITLPWQVQNKLQKVLVVYCSPVLKGKRHQVLVQ